MTTEGTQRSLARRLPALALCAALQATLCASLAHAQVAVLRVDPAADGLCAVLESAITDAQLVRDPGYFAEANNQRMDPSADATLEGLVPLLGLRLAIVPQSADDRRVNVDFRDGQTGASLGLMAIPLENGLLSFLGRQVLRREVFKHLGVAPPATNPPSGIAPGEGTGAVGEEGGDAEDAGSEDAGSSDARGLLASAVIGLGFGMRSLEWPVSGEIQRVDTGMFAAYELAARFALPLSESTELGPEFAYQSSLSHEIEETHLDAPPEKVGIRSHRFAGLLALTVHLGETLSIAPAVGYGSRSLRPDVHHLLTPSYSLAGPIGRIAFGLAFGDSITLALAPELQWIVVGDELEAEGVDGSGLSVGGEALLELAFSDAVAAGLTFREAHALLSAGSGSAADVERFVTTHVRWTP